MLMLGAPDGGGIIDDLLSVDIIERFIVDSGFVEVVMGRIDIIIGWFISII